MRRRAPAAGWGLLAFSLCLLAFAARDANGQTFASRGFADARLVLYPQLASNDRTRAVGQALIRYEPSVSVGWLTLAGSFDARMDTHSQVERRWTIDWQDRGPQRPPFSIRRLSAVVSRAGASLELGKQFVRWGKADVLNPTDRFAPRDFMTVVDNEFLGVTGARLVYGRSGNTLDLVWVPRFTPSRIPLFTQRWSVVPSAGLPTATLPPTVQLLTQSPLVALVDGGARYPRGSQQGLRFNRLGAGYEFSVSFYNGFNHLPLIEPSLVLVPVSIALTRVFPQMRMYGADAAIPNRWFTLKGEFGYFTSNTTTADEYGIYVVQAERQVGEWLLVGGYAGDFVTRTGAAFRLTASPEPGAPPSTGSTASSAAFSAERGLSRAFLGRAAFTIDSSRSLAFEAAVRQNGDGSWVKAEYSQAYGGHLRATAEANWIRGHPDDFLGQFHRNSNVNFSLRFSF